ncbi:hypothetical protein SAY86_008446 [Trapa natans]|uniref:C2H2-type domain-containing protein n=1 Tax=Trapa natans TaxID=22666 RepID=A0AAN7QAZ1_TRANT|nr:hypothetical protein SAY86_008446 [Trapa natans]
MEKPAQFLGLRDDPRVIKRDRAHRIKRKPSPRGSTAMAASSPFSVQGGDCLILETPGQDEDMANCLILLAKGVGLANSDDEENPKEESASERSDNMINSVVGKSKVCELGAAVYECKTCNRVFPSFQALGGHRASHSKPASKGTNASDDQNRTRDRSQHHGQIHRNNLSPNSTPISLGSKPWKVHECSICGSEFPSGQALGGHMRRHRSSASIDEAAGESSRAGDPKRMKLPELDLNLPAPEEDDHVDSLFRYGQGGQPVQPLFFSASALVDCYY